MPSLNTVKLLPLICIVLFSISESLCNGESAYANVLCKEKEREALLEFKRALVDDYGRLSSWVSLDCCQWNGVQCNNQTGHVEKLDLHGDDQLQQYLRGEISTSLMDLPYLTCFDLSTNDFNGTQIPEFFGSLSKLRYLYLSYAAFGGKIPHQLGKLSSLQHLDLSWNNLVGVIPNQLGNLSNLQILKLGYNEDLKFGEEDSAEAEWISNLSSLTELELSYINLHASNNWVQTIGRLPYLAKLYLRYCNLSDVNFHLLSSQLNYSASLKIIDIGQNYFTSVFSWLFNFSSNLIELYLDGNLLEGPIPRDLGNKLSHLEVLELYGNQLNGTIPESIALLSELFYFDVAQNSLKGVITDTHLTNLTNITFLYFDHNSLTFEFNDSWIPPFQLKELSATYCKVGPAFPKWLHTQHQLSLLDFSNAGISDSILELSFLLCAGSVNNSLSLLHMSDNQLFGQIPDCLSNLRSLASLDLSNNKLSGNIPTTIGSLVEIEQLILRNNILTGELPSMKNCTNLILLDVGENVLTGSIPSWLGEGLQSLQMLVLRKNHFYGYLPLHLCYLTSMQILDLSMNNISGQIPKCLNNFTAMSEKNEFNDNTIGWQSSYISVYLTYDWEAAPFLMWKGQELEFKNIKFLKTIDLSSNQLSGEIPAELGDLVELVSFNLSRNHLSGHIPSELGKLHSLDGLDLSRNHLSGKIPSSLSQIDRLGVLDLSNNNLSGQIPIGTQLQSFNASAYSGNPELCGRPLVKSCLHEMPEDGHEDTSYEEDVCSLFSQGFYASVGIGFFTGFLSIFGSLLFIRSWRHAYFNFLNKVTNQIFVKAARYCRWLNN